VCSQPETHDLPVAPTPEEVPASDEPTDASDDAAEPADESGLESVTESVDEQPTSTAAPDSNGMAKPEGTAKAKPAISVKLAKGTASGPPTPLVKKVLAFTSSTSITRRLTNGHTRYSTRARLVQAR
jgi:hypothetical protein